MLRLSMMMIVIIWKLSIMNMVKKYQENGNRYLLCTDENGMYTLKSVRKQTRNKSPMKHSIRQYRNMFWSIIPMVINCFI